MGTIIEVGKWDGGEWVKITGLNIPLLKGDLLRINTKMLSDFMRISLGE